MKTLKQVLNENHKNKTKKELVDLITGIKGVVGPDYDKITGLQPSELSKTRNEDLVAIIGDFSENYNSEWEVAFANAPTKVIGMILEQEQRDQEFFAANTPANANFASELGNIPFENIIGGVLDAAVTAQTNASIATVDFIKEVGFTTTGTGVTAETKVRTVDFSYVEEDPADPNGTVTRTVEVPFISLLNVPTLRIETVDIDFNVQLNSVYTRDVSSQFGIDASLDVKFPRVKFNVSASYKRSTRTGTKVERTYNVGVKVRATNDEIPAGLEKVLNLLSA